MCVWGITRSKALPPIFSFDSPTGEVTKLLTHMYSILVYINMLGRVLSYPALPSIHS